MAYGIESTGSQLEQTTVSTLGWNHTITAATVLVVGVAFQGTVGSTPTASYNGVDMGAPLWNKRDDGGLQSSVGWLLINPAAGTYAVAVALGGTMDLAAGGSVGFTGISTSTPNRTPVTNNEAGGGTPTATVANAQAGDVIVDVTVSFADTMVVGADQTVQVADAKIAGGSTSLGISTQDAATSNVMTWSGTGHTFWAIGAMALIPGGAAGLSVGVGSIGEPVVGGSTF